MSSAVVVSSENLDGQQQSSSTPASPAAEKVNLLGMSRAELEKFFEDIGEKK
ncbi:23S rRNA (adenine(2503)-C(2))-methyltransferase RlmN, partial [Acinetobacter baumannii]